MRPRRGLPRGLIPFRYEGDVAGDSGSGIVTFVIDMNPGGSTLPRCMMVTDLFVRHSGIIPFDVQLAASDSHWEEFERVFLTGVTVKGPADTALRLIAVDRVLNLGRVTPGTNGNIQVVFETNTDSTTYSLSIRGLWAPKEFALPAGLGV